jgi:hypothetical protein
MNQLNMDKLGPCLLMDSEQTMQGLPYMFTIRDVRTDGTFTDETIIIEEVLNDRHVIGWEEVNSNGKRHVWSPGRDKIWNALTISNTPCRYMKYREFLNYIGSLCTNRGGAKDRTPKPMVSWSRDCDLQFMYNLDNYLPGVKFFKSNPRVNPSGCSDNVHWKKRIPQVCAQRMIVELCPTFYKKNVTNPKSPSSLEQAMRRIEPEYKQTHLSDQDVEDMTKVLLVALETEIPKMTFMFAKTDVIYSNLE